MRFPLVKGLIGESGTYRGTVIRNRVAIRTLGQVFSATMEGHDQ
jgi:hypothetical protein